MPDIQQDARNIVAPGVVHLHQAPLPALVGWLFSHYYQLEVVWPLSFDLWHQHMFRELPLTGYYIFVILFSVNPRDPSFWNSRPARVTLKTMTLQSNLITSLVHSDWLLWPCLQALSCCHIIGSIGALVWFGVQLHGKGGGAAGSRDSVRAETADSDWTDCFFLSLS